MAYVKKKFFLRVPTKVFKFLIDEFGLSLAESQRWIDKKRVYEKNILITEKAKKIQGEIEVVVFEPVSKGLEPIFQTNDFALFDKPSGLLIHPKNRNTDYSLTHEIKHYYGKDANVAHRIDKETSGLVLAAKNKKSEITLKQLFENKQVDKGYLALVRGKIETSFLIDKPILKSRDYSTVKLKVYIDSKGKKSQTFVKPIKYFSSKDYTLIEAIPLTGRQHQIRVHMFHVKHPIVGDPIYGVDTGTASMYLDGILNEAERKKTTGAKRLMLHANWIAFTYKNKFKMFSKDDFIEEVEKLCSDS